MSWRDRISVTVVCPHCREPNTFMMNIQKREQRKCSCCGRMFATSFATEGKKE